MVDKRPITAEDFMNIDMYSDPQFSPSGDSYVFVSTSVNDEKEYEAHLFYQKLNDNQLIQWTFGKSKNDHPRFSPDGSKLAFVSNRSGTNQIWLLHTQGGEARQLTSFKHGATNPEWSKDGRSLFFTASLEENDDLHEQRELTKEERELAKKALEKQPFFVNRLKYKSDAHGFHLHHRNNHIIQYDMTNGTYTKLTTADRDHMFQDSSPDGKYILLTANLNETADRDQTNDLFLLDLETKELTKLTDGKYRITHARFSNNGQKIAWLGHDFQYKMATLQKLYIYDLQNHENKCLSEHIDMHLGLAFAADMRMGESEIGPIWSQDEQKIYVVGMSHGASGLYEIDLQGHLQPLHQQHEHLFGFSYHPKTQSFILGISTPTNPCDFYLKKNEELTPLTDANREFLDDVFLSEPEEFTFHRNGFDIQGWIMRPYGFKEGEKYPLILEVHGGPHAMYGQTFFHEMQLLASKGYAVLYTNPRGSHGYGQAFVNAVRTDYGSNDYEDLMKAVDVALERFDFIDEDRLGVTGGSYGGFMTNWIVSHTNRFKAAVTQRSISNWISFNGVSDIGYYFTEWEHGTSYLEDPAKLWDISPLKYVKQIETPLLILHGELDYRCPIEQAEQLFMALKQLDKEVEFVRFPGANHELSRSGDPTMRIYRLQQICRWFETYL